MAISTATALYRVRIADRGATVVSGNVALTLALADMATIPVLTGASVNLLKGSSQTIRFSVDCATDGPLFVDSGRMSAIGRLLELQRSENDGGSWSTVGTGRISGVSEPEKGLARLLISDERWVERKTQIFTATDTVQLHPPGLADDWADFDAAGTTTYTVEDVDGNAVLLSADRIGTASKDFTVPRSLRVALAADLMDSQDLSHSASNSAGNFDALRFDLVSGAPTPGDRTVISFSHNLSQLATPNAVLSGMSPGAQDGGKLTSAWVYFGSGHGLTGGETITGRFYFATPIRVRKNIPLHIGGANGVHPMTLLRDILDGTYGGQAMVYPSAVLDALEALPLPPVWVRVTEPKDRANWNEANHFSPYAVAPLTGTDLQYRPTFYAMPQDEDPTGLPVLTAANGATAAWDHGSQDLVTAIELTAKVANQIDFTSDRGDDWPVDEIELDEIFVDIEHDNISTLGRVVERYDTELIFATDTVGGESAARDVIRTLGRALFAVFGDGGQRGNVTVPDDAGHEVGDLVLLDQDTLQGFNPNTGDRSGDRLVRLITPIEITPASTKFEYLDMGPDDQPLATPTVTVAQNGTDPDLIDVTVSGVPAGATAVVQVTESATTPAETDWARVRSGVGNETISFRLRAASGTAWARAKSVAPHRIQSPWDTDSVSLSTRALLRGMGVVRTTLTDFEASWRVDAGTTGGIRADYDIHNRNEPPVIDGTNQADYDAADGSFEVLGALRSTAEMATVRLTPYPGFSGGSVTGTPGEPLERSALIVQARGSRAIYRATLASVTVDFDPDGEVVVSAQGDDEAVSIYVTVGDGVSPSNPTAGANDGTISGRSGTVNTGVKVTTGNSAFVRVVAADLNGNLGPVTEVEQARRMGPFHADSSTRSHTGDTVETTLETITVPADVLGSNGRLLIEVVITCAGTAGAKTLRLNWGGALIEAITLAAGFNGGMLVQLSIVNDASPSAQDIFGFALEKDAGGGTADVRVIRSSGTVDTTSDADVEITGQLANSGDTISVETTIASYQGTS